MKRPIAFIFIFTTLGLACAKREPAPTITQEQAQTPANVLQSLHVRLEVNPQDGGVRYLGWYDGQRNLLGPHGITAALAGMEPPEMSGDLKKVNPSELRFAGTDQNKIQWVKRYRLDDRTVSVTYRLTSLREEPFDAIVYSMAHLPDATISGDNRDQYIHSPVAEAHFRASIENPHFPGEQMNPFALRSDARRLEPGDSMEFEMTWELKPPAR